MDSRAVFVFIIMVLTPLIFFLAIDNAMLGGKIEYQKALIDGLIQDVNYWKNSSDKFKEIIQDSIVMRDNYNKTVNYMFGEATAYHPPSGGINSDSNPRVTSIGLKAEVGIIAVNPKIIPYGSEIMIISGNTVIRGIAGDTGGDMRQNPRQVDILMGSKEKADKWGRKSAHVLWWEE